MFPGRRIGAVASIASASLFASNFNSAAAGTQMTNPGVVDRQFKGSIYSPNDLSASQALVGGHDSYGWPWFAGDYTQPPLIDTPANISSAIGATVTPPPDGFGTVMAIQWNGGTAAFTGGISGTTLTVNSLTSGPIYPGMKVSWSGGSANTVSGSGTSWTLDSSHAVASGTSMTGAGMEGAAPFTCWPPFSGLGITNPTKFYCCFRVFVPSNFDSNQNGIKFIQLTHSGSNPNSNNLFETYGWNNPPFSYSGALVYISQGDVKDGASVASSAVLIPGAWHVVEFFAKMESPSGAANGVVYLFLDGQLVGSTTAWTFSGATGIAYFNQGGIIPYYGGGGIGGPTANRWLVFGRMMQAFSSS